MSQLAQWIVHKGSFLPEVHNHVHSESLFSALGQWNDCLTFLCVQARQTWESLFPFAVFNMQPGLPCIVLTWSSLFEATYGKPNYQTWMPKTKESKPMYRSVCHDCTACCSLSLSWSHSGLASPPYFQQLNSMSDLSFRACLQNYP